jgi:superfamily II DNA or RNA helicase
MFGRLPRYYFVPLLWYNVAPVEGRSLGWQETFMDTDALIAGTAVQPRPYQARIVRKAADLFARQNLRSVLIDSPTGSGKTIMALLIAKALQDEMGVRVGWVAMRRYLLDQAEEENQRHRIGVEASYVSMFDRDPPTGLDLLVVDEAQHDAAQSMAVLHQRIRPRFILGLSATPFRADRIKLCFDVVLKDAGIAALIQDGYLSPYHHYTLPKYDPLTTAAFYLREPKRWGRSLFYFRTVAECDRVAGALREGGVRAEVVTGSSDRDRQLAQFAAGEIDVLCNCMVLSEGFNCPQLRTVFCRPSCKSVTIQMAGRVLRRHPDFAAKQIVQCNQTRWPFARTAAPAIQYVWAGDEWRSLEVNPRITQVNLRTLQALAKSDAQLPEYVLRRAGWLRARREHEAKREAEVA